MAMAHSYIFYGNSNQSEKVNSFIILKRNFISIGPIFGPWGVWPVLEGGPEWLFSLASSIRGELGANTWTEGQKFQLALSSRLFLRKLPTNEETLPCLAGPLGALVGLSPLRRRWKRRCFLSGSLCSEPSTQPRLPESTSFLSVGLLAEVAASAFRSEDDDDLRRYVSRLSGDELCSRSRSICSLENNDECFLQAPDATGLLSDGSASSIELCLPTTLSWNWQNAGFKNNNRQ